MIALISVLILEAAISLCGVIESSQLLCCNAAVSVCSRTSFSPLLAYIFEVHMKQIIYDVNV